MELQLCGGLPDKSFGVSMRLCLFISTLTFTFHPLRDSSPQALTVAVPFAQVGVASGLPVDDLGYSAPAWVRAMAVGASLVGGLALSVALGQGLGDATWSVSSGMGACMAAGVYEVR